MTTGNSNTTNNLMIRHNNNSRSNSNNSNNNNNTNSNSDNNIINNINCNTNENIKQHPLINIPSPLLDGPLYSLNLQQQNDDNIKNINNVHYNGNKHDETGIQQCIQLLLSIHYSKDCHDYSCYTRQDENCINTKEDTILISLTEEEIKHETVAKHCYTLIYELTKKTNVNNNVKDKLSSLRIFRNKITKLSSGSISKVIDGKGNVVKRKHSNRGGNGMKGRDNKQLLSNMNIVSRESSSSSQWNMNDIQSIIIGTYRILLELSLSTTSILNTNINTSIPPSLNRSYRSCLIILEPYLLHTHDCEIYCKDDINKTTTTNSTTFFHSILYDVILSILLDSKKLPKSWNDSMSSLGQLLAYDTAAKYIIVGCDNNKSLSSNILFEFALQCFLTSPRLSLPHSPSSNNNNDNTNTTNTKIIAKEDKINLEEMENKIITLKDLLYAASRFNCYCWNNLQPLSRSSVSSSPLSPSSPTRILQQLLSQVAQETIVPFLQKRQRRKKSNSSNTTSIVSSSDITIACGVTFGLCLLHGWKTIAVKINTTTGNVNDGDDHESNDYNDNIAKEANQIIDRLFMDGTILININDDDNDNGTTMTLVNDKSSTLAVVRGLAASLTDDILRCDVKIGILPGDGHGVHSLSLQKNGHKCDDENEKRNNNDHYVPLICRLTSYVLHLAHISTDNAIRLSAIRGLEAMVGRCSSILINVPSASTLKESKVESNDDDEKRRRRFIYTQRLSKEAKHISQELLNLALVTWESPPCRQVGCAVPGLFKCVIVLLRSLDDQDNKDENDNDNEKKIVDDSSNRNNSTDDNCDNKHTTPTDKDCNVSSNINNYNNDNKVEVEVRSSLDKLAEQILAQPSHRKGRYVAIQELLPIIGAIRLLELASPSTAHNGYNYNEINKILTGRKSNLPLPLSLTSSPLIDSLISGIISDHGDGTGNAGVASSLFGKFLSSLGWEMMTKLIEAKEVIRVQDICDKDSSNNININKSIYESVNQKKSELKHVFPPTGWTETWMRPLLMNLVSCDAKKAKRTSQFCLPAIVTAASGVLSRFRSGEITQSGIDAGRLAFASILDHLGATRVTVGTKCELIGVDDKSSVNDNVEYNIGVNNHYDEESESFSIANHRLLWAKLEVTRQALAQNLISQTKRKIKKTKQSSSAAFVKLKISITKAIPEETLRNALVHSSEDIRSVAFSSLEAVVSTYHGEKSSILFEIELWRESLPYAFKGIIGECAKKMMILLKGFMTRLLFLEGNVDDHESEIESGTSVSTSFLKKFVVTFLLNEQFVRAAGYPGTVRDKETLSLSLIDCIMSFAFANCTSVGSLGEASGAQQRRQLTEIQLETNDCIIEALLSSHVTSSLLAMHHSQWNETREFSNLLLCKIIQFSQLSGGRWPLPNFLGDFYHRGLLLSKSMHLASSPRQRESDAGARLLNVFCTALPTTRERINHLHLVCRWAGERMSVMENLIMGRPGRRGLDDSKSSDGYRGHEVDGIRKGVLPLVHGLIQSLRLGIDVCISKPDNKHVMSLKCTLYKDIVKFCCRAIEMSLVVVADVKHCNDRNNVANTITALPHVDTGCLNANASFASVNPNLDKSARLATQRIVVGTWLLTKEACATLASAMVAFPLSPPVELVELSGKLLIRAMISLKHQGAAYAAHKSLQRLCEIICNDEDSASLPQEWSVKLLNEISSDGTVRDSTLRRSTGFALGFLSVMRAEHMNPPLLFHNVISNLLRLSLPPTFFMKQHVVSWGFVSSEAMFLYPSFVEMSEKYDMHVKNEAYNWRCRVHAFNILRLIIMDSPLASQMREFIGDAIISSLIGYEDSSWAVRNSATMTFSAAMLKVIDANKNATGNSLENLASKGQQGNRNAISARELFRCYPSLPTFLLSLIKKEVSLSSKATLHPPLFPLLLLLSRLQPASFFAANEDVNEFTVPFIDIIFQCLSHPIHKIRLVSSRAIAVLCTGNSVILLERCVHLISSNKMSITNHNHNHDHGALLTIKALLKTSPNPSDLFCKPLSNTVMHFASWSLGSLQCPPSCVSIALEILQFVYESTNEFFGNQMDLSLVNLVYRVVNYVETLNKKSSVSRNLIGLPCLAAVSATFACKLSKHIILDVSLINGSLRHLHLNRIQVLFRSECFDVKVQSVKAFKKSLWTTLDHIVNNRINHMKGREKAVNDCCRLTISALIFEAHQEFHGPTLRRLSRCLIESLVASRSIHKNLDILLQLKDSGPIELWDILFKIINYQNNSFDSMKNVSLNVNNESGMTSLDANMLELMSLLLPANIFSKIQNYDKNWIPRLYIFVESIEKASNSLFWKVRYSVAKSLENIRILTKSYPCNNQKLSRLHLRLRTTGLQLLQDIDQDVRYSAGIGLLGRSGSACVPLMILEQSYKRTSRDYFGSTLILHSFKQINDECRAVEKLMDFILMEFLVTKNISPSNLWNLNTERKIFEEEISNSYEEVLVTCQVSAKIIMSNFRCDELNFTSDGTEWNGEEMTDFKIERELGELEGLSVLTKCQKMLKQLKDCYVNVDGKGKADVVYDVTWSQAFPIIHGLVIGSIAAIYIGIEDTNDVTQDANGLIKYVSTKSIESIHPSVLEAVNVLSIAAKGSDETYHGLMHCCFLLPSVTLKANK